MATITPWRYQFDEFGTNPANRIISEPHNLTATDHLPFPVTEGLFYADSMVIRVKGNNTPLIKGTDYVFGGLDSWIAAKTGQTVAATVEIKNKNWTGELELTYQCVGGAEGMPLGMVQKLLDAITQASTNPSIEYPKDIKNLPIFFPPAPHSHPLETLEQIELLNMALRDVHNALINRIPMIESGNSHQEQIDRILGLIAGMRRSVNQIQVVAGTAAKIDDIIKQLTEFETIADNEINLTSGQTLLIGEWDLTKINYVSGSVSFKAGSDVDATDFRLVGTTAVAPKVVPFGRISTASQLFTLEVVRVSNSLRLSVKATVAGKAKSKLYGAL